MNTHTLLLSTACLILSVAPAPALADDPVLSVRATDETISIFRGEIPVLTYHKADVPPPEGVDPVFHRSGFIYPLHAPSGGIVTGIHPDDHYHHLGLWHAWVHTEYDGKELDFWNLKTKTGRVRYAGDAKIRESGFTVTQEQVGYLAGPDGEPTVILKESFNVDVAYLDGANVIDYVVDQTNVTEKPLILPAYRYGGGIAYRGPLGWNAENSAYLTDLGKTRVDSHTTRARWVAMFGPAENGDGKDATVVILCHPKNHDAPQHVRTWDNGKIFFNYVPIQETGWEIEAGKTVTMKYRLVIFDGKPGTDAIEARWKAYAGE